MLGMILGRRILVTLFLLAGLTACEEESYGPRPMQPLQDSRPPTRTPEVNPLDRKADQLLSVDPGVRERAAKELAASGMDGLHRILDRLDQVPEEDATVRQIALRGLEDALGTSTEGVQVRIVSLLGRVGPLAVNRLTVLLGDERVEVRLNALDVLLDMESWPEATSNKAVELTHDPDAEVRRQALRLVARSGNPRARDRLIQALKDPDPGACRQAIRLLAGLPDKTGVAQSLGGLLEHADEDVALEAVRTLAQMGPAARPAFGALLEAGKAGNTQVGYEAVPALVQVEPDLKRVVSTLAGLLSASDPKTRMLAADELGKLGTQAAASKGALENAAQDPDLQVRGAAARALVRVTGGGPTGTKG